MGYKEQLGVTVDRDVKHWLIEWCEDNSTTLSVGTNYLLRKMMNQIIKEQNAWKDIPLIDCKCGAKYSSKLPKCPNCGEEHESE